MKQLLNVVCFALALSALFIRCDNEVVQPENHSTSDSILIIETVDYIYIEYLDYLVICRHDTTDVDINNDKIYDLRFVVKEYIEEDRIYRYNDLISLSDSFLISVGDTYFWDNIRYVEEGERLDEEWVNWWTFLYIYSYHDGITTGDWGRSDKTSGYIVIKKPIIEGSQSYGWLKMAANDTSFTLYESLMYKKPTPFIYIGDTTKYIP